MKNSFTILRIFFLLFVMTNSPSKAEVCDFSAVNSSVESLLQKYPIIPGAGLQIGIPGEIIFENYWGEYDETTSVPLASATKLLSAITVMATVDDGLLNLDEPVSRYLPQFTGDKGLMTVRQMFSHTAGMPYNSQLQNSVILNARNGLTLAQAVDVLACCEPLLYQPGTGFAYGGSSMHISGRVVEVVNQESWIDTFNKHLSIPLGITSMDYNGLGVTENYRISGGAQSKLPDYGKVLEMLLNKGRYQTSRVLSENAIAEIITDNVGDKPIIYAPPQVNGEVRYGLGTWLRLDANEKNTGLFSPGAFGFTPWVDYDLNYYAAFMVKDLNSRMAAPISEIRDQIRQILTDNWCGSKTQALTDELGLWYDPNYNGHGLEIQKIGDSYSGVFYTFSESGKAQWYLLNVQDQTTQLSGELLHITNRGSNNAIEASSETVGIFSIDFNPSQSNSCSTTLTNKKAELTWTINNEQGTWCLEPLLTVNSRAKTNANGWWWNGADDSGWGFDVYANDDTEFRVVYYYDELGNPIWALATGETDSNDFDMQSPKGYCRSCEMIPLQLMNIGSFNGKLQAASIDRNSTSTISLDISDWKRIDFIPQIFSNPAY